MESSSGILLRQNPVLTGLLWCFASTHYPCSPAQDQPCCGLRDYNLAAQGRVRWCIFGAREPPCRWKGERCRTCSNSFPFVPGLEVKKTGKFSTCLLAQ